jgi:ankyrin repeat protein
MRSAEEVAQDLVELCHPFLVIQSKIQSRDSVGNSHELETGLEWNEERNEERNEWKEEGTVNLIHQSARDFMHSCEMPTAFRFQSEKVHFEMAWRCIDLIQESASKFAEAAAVSELSLVFGPTRRKVYHLMFSDYYDTDSRPAKNPILGYGMESWSTHARNASSLAKALLKHPSKFFDERSMVRSWWYYNMGFGRQWHGFPGVDEPLNLSAHTGFVPWIEKVLAGGWLRKPAVNREIQVSRANAFLYAARQGHGAAMELLLEYGARVDLMDTPRLPVIHRLAESGNEMAVRACINHGTSLVAAGLAYATPLHFAAEGGHSAVVQLFIGAGVDLDAKDYRQETALMKAAHLNQSAIVRILLDCGAEVRTKNADGASALDLAAENGNKRITRMLLDRGATYDKASALRRAASQGDEAEVRRQLDDGVPVDAIDYEGLSALFGAAIKGHSAVAKLLIARGANIIAFVAACDFDGEKTDIHARKSRFRQNIGDALQRCNSATEINAVDHRGRTALHLGVDCVHISSGSMIIFAPERLTWHVSLVRALLDQGANIDTGDKQGLTALHYAGREGITSTVQLLLDRGAKIDAADKHGLTVLHYAAREDITSTVQLLLDRGAKIDAADRNGLTALDHVVREGKSSTVQLLLDRGAQIEARDHEGWTPLQAAIGRRPIDVATLTLLLDHGVEVDVEDGNGLTSLHHAVSRGDQRAIRTLLDRGAQVDARDHKGRTPLHLAAESSRCNMYPLVLLLDYGADINARDLKGLTPLKYAKKLTNGGSTKLLRHRGAV